MKSCMADVVEADGDHPAQMAFGIQLGYQIGFQVHQFEGNQKSLADTDDEKDDAADSVADAGAGAGVDAIAPHAGPHHVYGSQDCTK